MIQVEKILQELVSIPSVTGDEKAVGEYLFSVLQNQGFETVKQKVDKDRFNIIAKIGIPKLYFSAHIDTVPPYIAFSQNDTHFFGRGACDTKGCIASMLAAAFEVKLTGLSGFGLIFTVGEETDFKGVKKGT